MSRYYTIETFLKNLAMRKGRVFLYDYYVSGVKRDCVNHKVGPGLLICG